MIAYVVVTVFEGCISDVKGFSIRSEAEAYLEINQDELGIEPDELGIEPDLENESQNDVQLHELDIEFYPTSVAVRRQRW